MGGPTTPTWLEDTLRARGVWNDDGISRKARARRCRDCRAVVLAGLDADRCGGPVRVDPTPLTPLAETLTHGALSRATYRLRWITDHYELDPRWDFEVTMTPAEPGVVDVVPEHTCGMPVSTVRLKQPDTRTTTVITETTPCPY